MNTTDHRPRRPPGTEAGELAGPITLGEIVDWLIANRDDIKNLRDISRKTTIPYQTLYSWWKGSRNMTRPPAEVILRKFAADLDLAEGMVFRAAGRAFSEPGQLADGELQVLHLYQELSDEDRAFAETMLRNLAERARHQGVTQR